MYTLYTDRNKHSFQKEMDAINMAYSLINKGKSVILHDPNGFCIFKYIKM